MKLFTLSRCCLLVMGLSFFGLHPLWAHGPGRSVQVDTGYCAPQENQMIRTQQVQARFIGEKIPFCFRLHNLESVPLVIQLRFLPGSTMSNGVDVCQMVGENVSVSQGHFFQRGDKKCQKTTLLLEPLATQEVQGYWVFRPNLPTNHQPSDSDSITLINCILSKASPQSTSRTVHLESVHVKSKHALHMVQIQGDQGISSNEISKNSGELYNQLDVCDQAIK